MWTRRNRPCCDVHGEIWALGATDGFGVGEGRRNAGRETGDTAPNWSEIPQQGTAKVSGSTRGARPGRDVRKKVPGYSRYNRQSQSDKTNRSRSSVPGKRRVSTTTSGLYPKHSNVSCAVHVEDNYDASDPETSSYGWAHTKRAPIRDRSGREHTKFFPHVQVRVRKTPNKDCVHKNGREDHWGVARSANFVFSFNSAYVSN